MAINTYPITWECESGGNALNGGGFAPGIPSAGTDYSQQTSPQLTLTDIATTDGVNGGIFHISSTTGGFTAAMIGNLLCIQHNSTATDWGAGRVIITAVTDTHNITVQAVDNYTLIHMASCAGGHCRVGGCLTSPYLVMGRNNNTSSPWSTEQDSLVYSNAKVWVKGSCPCVDFTAVTTTGLPNAYEVEGYTTTRGDGGPATLTLIQEAGSNYIQLGGDYSEWVNLIFDAASFADVCCNIQTPSFVLVRNCTFKNGRTWGIVNSNLGADVTFEECIITLNGNTNMTTPGFPSSGGLAHERGNGCSYRNLYINNNKGPGLYVDDAGTFERVRCYNNRGPGIYHDTSSGAFYSHCVADRNDLSGLLIDGSGVAAECVNCAFTNNGHYGVEQTTENDSISLNNRRVVNCAYYNNTSGASHNYPQGTGAITLTAEPYVNAVSGNFLPNTTAGGGTLLRGVGVPVYLDVGSDQHQDTGGGTTVRKSASVSFLE
jgi:hypothetical protein